MNGGNLAQLRVKMEGEREKDGQRGRKRETELTREEVGLQKVFFN